MVAPLAVDVEILLGKALFLEASLLQDAGAARIQDIHIGSIAVASALSYLDFRQPQFNWREGRPVVTQMLETFSKRISMIETDPQK